MVYYNIANASSAIDKAATQCLNQISQTELWLRVPEPEAPALTGDTTTTAL
jgi:hypothetical protein